MDQCPSEVDLQQLQDIHISVQMPNAAEKK